MIVKGHTLQMERYPVFPLPDKHRPKCSCGWKGDHFVEKHGEAKAEGRLHIAQVSTS